MLSKLMKRMTISGADRHLDKEVEEESGRRVFRLLGEKILGLACNIGEREQKAVEGTDGEGETGIKPWSPDYETIRACRLVSKEWRGTVASLFWVAGKPVLSMNPENWLKVEKKSICSKSMMQVLKEGIPLPHVTKKSDLVLPTIKLTLPASFFYEDVEADFGKWWIHVENAIQDIHFTFPSDSNCRFEWLDGTGLEALKTVVVHMSESEHKSKKPTDRFLGQPVRPQHIHKISVDLIQRMLTPKSKVTNVIVCCDAPEFAGTLGRLLLPPEVRRLEVPLVKSNYGDWHLNKSGSSKLKRVVIRAPIQVYYNDEEFITGSFASLLLQQHGDSLEEIELLGMGQEADHFAWYMTRQHPTGLNQKGVNVEIRQVMPKVKSIRINSAKWEISEFEGYGLLPSLANLTLEKIFQVQQIRALYASPSATVRRLSLFFVEDMPEEVLTGFSTNLPNLQYLDIALKSNDGGLGTCFHGFKRLKILKVVCHPSKMEDLRLAVTGIPKETYQELLDGASTVMDVMKEHQHKDSIRNLRDLEEVSLKVGSRTRLDWGFMMATSVMRMPKVKTTVLSNNLVIEDQILRSYNSNGVVFKWE